MNVRNVILVSIVKNLFITNVIQFSVLNFIIYQNRLKTELQPCLPQMLSARDRQVEQRSSKPLLGMYYDKLMDYRTKLENMLPT